ncbi:molecular chaperone DnaJ [Pedobacter paludis]|uniref:Molecular chaperone DnaJ n=1 Tax=Pedobacter paludis TaxID=2203212 RepID=A0A317F4P2_9SPHI|nr:molecular chaperone DnaJ [Pedobacter paludis]PWS33293.1 molecular chaperone DnaJ [Pedobacter paludis]
MKWFKDWKTLDEVKALYKKLAKAHHPDFGGCTSDMQEINTEYAFASARVIKSGGLSDEETENEIRYSQDYREAIESIIHLKGLIIEVVGNWIWVTGNTKVYRCELKGAGYYFASKKLAWYFRTGEFKVRKGGRKSLDEIRAKYGIEVVSARNVKRGQFIRG